MVTRVTMKNVIQNAYRVPTKETRTSIEEAGRIFRWSRGSAKIGIVGGNVRDFSAIRTAVPEIGGKSDDAT